MLTRSKLLTSLALGLTIAGPVQAAFAAPAHADDFGRRSGWDRGRRDNTGLVVGLAALAGIAVIAATAAKSRNRDGDWLYSTDGVRAATDRCQEAARSAVNSRFGWADFGRVTQVDRSGRDVIVKGTVRVDGRGRRYDDGRRYGWDDRDDGDRFYTGPYGPDDGDRGDDGRSYDGRAYGDGTYGAYGSRSDRSRAGEWRGYAGRVDEVSFRCRTDGNRIASLDLGR
ncbi:MAG: hypothetical protein RQ833_11000 [Sphingomonadaceae bacterium]|nr:hypothetical protein [Sphingomonadaceae bacterium]